MTKNEIADVLSDIATLLELQGENPFKVRAYQTGARALEAIHGVPPVYIREGGSIPVTAAFDHALGLPVVLLGFTQPACNAHAPNEKLSLNLFYRGIETVIHYMALLPAAMRKTSVAAGTGE